MRGKRWLPVLSLLLGLLLVVSCQPVASYGDRQSTTGESAAMATSAPMATQAPRELEDAKGGAAPAANGADMDSYSASLTEQMIIRTVQMTLRFEDVEKSSQEIMSMIAGYRGYVSGSNLWHEGDNTYASITLRVPAESLDALLVALRGKAVSIESENVSTQDVSQEYVDLDSRLRNLEATETELLVVLDNIYEKSYKADDILTIYREITQIRAQIEEIKGRQQYLSQMAALATVNVELRPVATPPTVVVEGKWNPMVAVNTSLRNLVGILQGLYEVIIVIVLNVLPVLAMIALPVVIIWLLVRAASRRKARKQAAPTA